MGDDIKPEVIKKTQESLGKYVKRPPLTEKLLRKPPFRFLHDIVTCVIRETGFMTGIFTPEELNHENIKNKESKIAFLQKLIDTVQAACGKTISARPSRIVAGHEPAKTNELLQAIAKALDRKAGAEDKKQQQQQQADQRHSVKKDKPSHSKASTKSNVTGEDPGEQQQVGQLHSVKKDKQSHSKALTKSSDDAAKKAASNKKTTNTKPPSVERKHQNSKDSTKTKSSTQKSDSRQGSLKASKKADEEQIDGNIEPKGRSSVKDSLKERNEEIKPDSREPVLNNSEVPESDTKQQETSKSQEPLTPPAELAVNMEKNKDQQKPSPELDISTTQQKSTARQLTAKLERDSRKLVKDAEKTKHDYEPANTVSKSQEKDVNMASNDAHTPGLKGATSRIENNNKPVKDNDETSALVLKENIPRPKTARLGSARPMSARPAAPRIRDRGEVVLPEEVLPAVGKVNIITESDQMAENDENENYVVESQEQQAFEKVSSPVPTNTAANDVKHGHLVSQILETQKELEEKKPLAGESYDKPSKRVEIEWEGGLARERDAAAKEVERLQLSIQTLTRAANPLGKWMDFLQEDVDTMQRELESWKSTNKDLRIQLEHEQSLTHHLIEPLRRQLQHLEKNTEDQNELISALKSKILQNDAHIKNLLTEKLLQINN